MPIQKSAVFPLVVAGGLVAAVAVAIAGGDDDNKPAEVAKAEPEDEAEEAERPARYKSGLCRKLRCTVDQDEPIYELIIEHREQAKARAKEAKKARAKLADLYAADEVDDEAMRAVYGQIAEAEGKVQLQAYESMLTLHSLLSPEQRTTLGKMLARVPPEEILGKRATEKPRKGKARRARRDAAAGRMDPADRAARAEAAKARRAAAAAARGGDDAGLDAAARRRAVAEKNDDGGAALQ